MFHSGGVLVVDDYGLYLRAWSRALDARGIAAHLTSCGVEAQSLASRFSPECVIVDLFVLGASSQDASRSVGAASSYGIEIVRRLRRLLPRSLVLLASAHLSRAYADEARSAGADGTYCKSRGIGEVLALLKAGVLPQDPEGNAMTLARVEYEHVTRVFVEEGRNVSASARKLGITRARLLRKLWEPAPRQENRHKIPNSMNLRGGESSDEVV